MTTLLSLTLIDVVAEQPFAPSTVTRYWPAARLSKSSVVEPFDQINVKGDCPPETLKSTLPTASPQMAGVWSAFKMGSSVVVGTVKLLVDVQVPPALTVTVYVPPETACKSSVVVPFDQAKV